MPAELAARQHGLVSLHQLVGLGLSPHAVSKRMRAGRLHRAHQGVYAVGHRRLTGPGQIRAHGCASLADADQAAVDGIPCTSLARTMLDCAPRLGHRGVEKAIERAEILRVFDRLDFETLLARTRGQRGTALLQRSWRGLQDAVHRESVREEGRIGALEKSTEPSEMSRALNRDARERGL